MKVATLFGASLLTGFAAAVTTCSASNKCPQDTPCCNSYGECGTEDYCTNGCDPQSSYDLNSCAPNPVCKAGTYTFPKASDIVYHSDYYGDSSATTWTYSGTLDEDNGNLRLTMPKNSVGTLIASTFYIWYGKVSVTMKTSHLAGVVSDFILMSDVKDEIDYEFIGTELENAQTNYYFQGILDWDNEVTANVSNSTYDNYHTYEIDWQYDSITWSIDGNQVRTLQKSDTAENSTLNTNKFPQTPSRIQVGIWPAGASDPGQGTIEWAGGDINWSAPDLSDPGYYFVELESVTVDCYDPPSGTNTDGSKVYKYTNLAGTQADVEITNDSSEVKKGSSSSSSSSATPSSTKSIANASQVQKTSSSQSIADASQVAQSSKTKSKSSAATSSASIANASQVASSSAATSSAAAGSSATADSSTAEATGSGAGSDDSAAAAASTSGGSSGSTATAASSSTTSSKNAGTTLSLSSGAALLFTVFCGVFFL